MKKRNLKGLKRKKDYLQTWLERFKESKDAIPLVQESLELTDWEIDTLENLPNKDNIEESNEDDHYDTNIDSLGKSLPMLPEINLESVFNIVVASTSGSSETYALVSGFQYNTEDLKNYGKQKLTIYQEIQAKQSRVEDVKNLIKRCKNDNLNQRFDRAYDA